MGKRKLTKEDEQRIISIYTSPASGGSWTGCNIIAGMYGVRAQTIRHVLVRNGVKMRNSKESHSNGKRCKPIVNLPTGSPPNCKCGCGQLVAWNQRKNKWNVYTSGHYRKDLPYKNEAWLRNAYDVEKRTVRDIAASFNVNSSAITKFMNKFGIARRSQAESLTISGAVRGERNPAWRGGVAKWAYSHDWKAVARSIRDRDQWTCQDCGERRKRWGHNLHVHHIDGNKLNNSQNNLVSLCSKCHKQRHRST